MNKENNRGAAGLRRSAIAERIRLRQEWSELKEIDETAPSQNILKKKPMNSRCPPTSNKKKQAKATSSNKVNQPIQVTSDVLTGVVALVDVGSEARALPLRAALTALGASIVTTWSPLVTHLVWTDSGTRAVRARARALACRVVSPLWVEACAAAGRRLREGMFPVASRQSDLPSPRTLRLLLKKAERENVPLVDLLSDSKEEPNMPRLRLRISSGTDTSRDKTTDTSNDTVDMESRINTAPRGGTTEPLRPPTVPPATRQPAKSRRKLFTHKEAQDMSSGDESDTTVRNRLHLSKLTQSEKRDLARAERMAKKLLAACDTQRANNNNLPPIQHGVQPKIVLTGMSQLERQAVSKCIHKLGGIIQNNVNKRTTHVLLGSCTSNIQCSNHASNITGISTHCDLSRSSCWSTAVERRARTLKALSGAARGARVLVARWAVDSAAAARWLHPHPYEVHHLRKIVQKARVERAALGRLNSEYAYDVFNGMRIRLSDDVDKRVAAITLLKLCGAFVQIDGQNGGQNVLQNGGQNVVQNGRQIDGDSDIVIGNNVGEVNSKWVFDSVAVARMRTTRRYINMNSYTEPERENR